MDKKKKRLSGLEMGALIIKQINNNNKVKNRSL